VTLPRPHGLTLLDVFMIHPRCPACIAAVSELRGAAADLRDRSKYQAHAGHLHPSHTFVPAIIETYRHLGRPIMRYLRTLSDIASERSPAVTRGSLLASAHRELSVALAQNQGCVYRSCVLLLAKAAGRQVLPGADTAFLDCAFCRPHVDLLLAVYSFILSVLDFFLGASGSLRLLSILTDHCACFPRPCRL
jgi:hypothetical protein